MADKIRDWLVARYPSPKAESPIEALLSAALDFMAVSMPACPGSLEQQQSIGNYRADFLVSTHGPDKRTRQLVIEVDGHDFHERTKEQAARDKARDRYMVTQGIEVLRYTGSEVWANPFACAEEIRTRWYVLHFGMTDKQAIGRAHLAEMRKFFEDDAA